MIKTIVTSTTSGGQRKTKEKARKKEKVTKAKEDTETDTQGRIHSKATGVKTWDTGQGNTTRRQLTS